MAFTQASFGPISSHGNSDMPNIWTYRTDDTKSQVIAQGYFIKKYPLINKGDVIHVDAVDDYFLGKFRESGSGYAISVIVADGDALTLQEVTDNGNSTTNPLVLFNDDASRIGFLGQDDFFGMTLVGSDSAGQGIPVTLSGSSVLIGAETLALVFNGARSGNFLRLQSQIDINGNDVFSIGSTPLDVTEYDEEFTSNSDVALTNSYKSIISSQVVNEYRAESSFAEGLFRLENTSTDAETIQYYITSNGAPPTEVFEATAPKRQGGSNGVIVVDFTDTSSTLVNPSDIVTIEVRQVSGATVTVTGSITPTKLKMVQNASTLTQSEVDWVSTSTTNLQFEQAETTDSNWTEIGRYTVPADTGVKVRFSLDSKRSDDTGYFTAEYALLVYRNGTTEIPQGLETVVRKTTQNGLNFRAAIDGNDMVLEVKGRNGQEWDWDLTIYFKEID